MEVENNENNKEEEDKSLKKDEEYMSLSDSEEENKVTDPNEVHGGFTVSYKNIDILKDFVTTPIQRNYNMEEVIKHFKFIIPKAIAKTVDFRPSKMNTQHLKEKAYERFAYQKLMSNKNVN